jgi:hypothetical protein
VSQVRPALYSERARSLVDSSQLSVTDRLPAEGGETNIVSAREESMTRAEGREAGGSRIFGRGNHGRVRAQSQRVGHLIDPELPAVVSLPARVHEVVVDELTFWAIRTGRAGRKARRTGQFEDLMEENDRGQEDNGKERTSP